MKRFSAGVTLPLSVEQCFPVVSFFNIFQKRLLFLIILFLYYKRKKLSIIHYIQLHERNYHSTFGKSKLVFNHLSSMIEEQTGELKIKRHVLNFIVQLITYSCPNCLGYLKKVISIN